jgi:hypothetical protein
MPPQVFLLQASSSTIERADQQISTASGADRSRVVTVKCHAC